MYNSKSNEQEPLGLEVGKCVVPDCLQRWQQFVFVLTFGDGIHQLGQMLNKSKTNVKEGWHTLW
jgi:hypothetical protein